MLIWKSKKKFGYRGRTCRIAHANVAGETQYRGKVRVETEVPDGLSEATEADVNVKQKVIERPDEDEREVWASFDFGTDVGDDLSRLVEEVKRVVDALEEIEG